MKESVAILSILLAGIILTSCKPTESNYKAAYEAALSKKNSVQSDAEEFGLVLEGRPKWRKVGTDSVMVMIEPLMRQDGDTLPVMNYNVAVGAYRMNTNAIAHAERLLAAGYKSRVLKNREGLYFTIAAQCELIEDTPRVIAEYMKRHPNDMYAGLPGRPVVEIPAIHHR